MAGGKGKTDAASAQDLPKHNAEAYLQLLEERARLTPSRMGHSPTRGTTSAIEAAAYLQFAANVQSSPLGVMATEEANWIDAARALCTPWPQQLQYGSVPRSDEVKL
ncbi:unnamed protein product [Zymoseptoria tritici ST99CH_3D7]|uniref:Uncharacterized protein n=1 Tax=Zymoseptoria tritici (strain ST99CH_3D7) TaxID=1276538 RepID=A0A1X7S028_ZYMT9|nr:unnamed protein product [Zymoseptoria tritici ST99CH_3D7]